MLFIAPSTYSETEKESIFYPFGKVVVVDLVEEEEEGGKQSEEKKYIGKEKCHIFAGTNHDHAVK